MKNYYYPLFVFLFLAYAAFSQNDIIINNEGLPPMTHYNGLDFGGNDATWAIIQDHRGLMYVGNTAGLQEFDGTNWRKVTTDGTLTPRSFAIGQNNIIYVAGINTMGYLAPNALGKMEYRSLTHLLPEDVEIGIQEYVKALNGKVYFNGLTAFCVYDEEQQTLQYYKVDRAYPSFIFKEQLYFLLKDQGLFTYENDTIVEAPNGQYFKGVNSISDFLAFGTDSVITITRTHDFHYYNGDTAYKKEYYIDPELKEKLPYKLSKISNEYNAICYLKAGLVVTDKHWNPILHFDESSTVNQSAFKTYMDGENNLWFGTVGGLYVMELGSSYSILDKSSGFSGYAIDIEEEGDKLYLATTSGLFVKTQNSKKISLNFRKIENSDLYNDDIVINDGAILVRAYNSTGQVVNGSYERIIEGPSNNSEIIFLEDSAFAMSIGSSGHSMQLYQNKDGNWTHFQSLENDVLPKLIFNLKHDHLANRIWGSNGNTLFSFSLTNDKKSIIDYKSYSTENGLPKDSYVWISDLGNELIFNAKDGVYEFDENSGNFHKSKKLKEYFDHNGLYKVIQMKDSSYVYSTYENEMGLMTINDDSFFEFKKWGVANLMPSNTLPIHANDRGAFFGANEFIGFVQNGKNEKIGFEFIPMIRQLDIIAGKDSTIFGGIFIGLDSSFSYTQQKSIELTYEQNAIRISYSIPYYRHPDKIQYQYLLEGFEEEWAEWTDKTQKEYTNLPAGNYVFKVKAMNGFLTESEVGQIEIRILAPWYQTWWAYFFYLLLFSGFIRLIIVWNSKRLKAENERLEEVIKERVKEIQEQKGVIAQSLKEKESLLKEIHHRVKNNLQIIANLLYLQSGKFEDENIKNVLEEGQGRVRSMALIHQKLYENEDLKSIPFGEYVLELVNEIKTSFGDQAAKVNVKVDAAEAFFDVDSAVPLGLIINELSTNAFKYAFEDKEEGQFNIFLTKSGDEYELHISDNGKGIPEEIDIRKTRSLGLRLVRILSEQLEGEYEFENNEGMSFKLKFVA